MAKKHDLSRPQEKITFRCSSCRYTFKAVPREIVDAPELEHHPYRYFATCEHCGQTVEQAPFQRALFKAWVNATGPKTPEGKAATAANLEGHPTPEEAMRTRFNAMKHGLNAKTATYFPARPDGYSFCAGCKVDRGYCATQSACEQQTMLFMQVHAAFEQRDPKKLTGIFAGVQAASIAVVQQILQTILADGVTLRNPEWFHEDGVLHLATYTDPVSGERKQIMNVEAHPLLKILSEFLTRNNMSLADLAMTPKVIEQQDEAMGRLKADTDDRGSVSAFMQQQTTALAALVDKMGAANERKKRDPVLIEYQRENGGEA